MAKVERAVRYQAQVTVFDCDLGEDPKIVASIERFVANKRDQCVGCAGRLGLKCTVSQSPNETAEEGIEQQLFGVTEAGIVTATHLDCTSPDCEAKGIIGEVADQIENHAFLTELSAPPSV